MENIKPSPFDSIIFDLDGTLWDAAETCAMAWNAAMAQSGNETYILSAVTVRSFSGLQINKVLQQYFNFIPEHKHEALLDLYKVNERRSMKEFGGVLYPGVKEVLNELVKEYRLFIVSNCLPGYIENFLQFHQLQHFFTDYECSGNTGLPKWENIQMIVKRNQLSSPVYVGDTIWDHEAATAAHVPFIYAAYGFGNVSTGVCSIDSFSELERCLFDKVFTK